MKGLSGPQPDHHPHPAHILVVDDDAESREAMHEQLRNAGYHVTTARDAVEAGHIVAERAPDLIVMDFKLPYMNGPEFIAAVRADATIPDLPVIFVTHLANARELAGKTFGFPLLTKPLVADELLVAVASQLGRR